jgi:hypothetical protein
MRKPGYVRLGAKRAGKARRRRECVDIDRRNTVLGNPFVLRDRRDAARAEVIELYRAQFEDDLRAGGLVAR